MELLNCELRFGGIDEVVEIIVEVPCEELGRRNWVDFNVVKLC